MERCRGCSAQGREAVARMAKRNPSLQRELDDIRRLYIKKAVLLECGQTDEACKVEEVIGVAVDEVVLKIDKVERACERPAAACRSPESPLLSSNLPFTRASSFGAKTEGGNQASRSTPKRLSCTSAPCLKRLDALGGRQSSFGSIAKANTYSRRASLGKLSDEKDNVSFATNEKDPSDRSSVNSGDEPEENEDFNRTIPKQPGTKCVPFSRPESCLGQFCGVDIGTWVPDSESPPSTPPKTDSSPYATTASSSSGRFLLQNSSFGRCAKPNSNSHSQHSPNRATTSPFPSFGGMSPSPSFVVSATAD
eukprot:gene8652-13381_t